MSITPSIRFAAHAFTTRVAPKNLWRAVSRPSYIEGFPNSYTPELVKQAEALLQRMADAEHGKCDDVDALITDLVSFNDHADAVLAGAR